MKQWNLFVKKLFLKAANFSSVVFSFFFLGQFAVSKSFEGRLRGASEPRRGQVQDSGIDLLFLRPTHEDRVWGEDIRCGSGNLS